MAERMNLAAWSGVLGTWVSIAAAGVDLAKLGRGLPQTRLQGTLRATMPDADRFVGSFDVRNAVAGPLDRRSDRCRQQRPALQQVPRLARHVGAEPAEPAEAESWALAVHASTITARLAAKRGETKGETLWTARRCRYAIAWRARRTRPTRGRRAP